MYFSPILSDFLARVYTVWVRTDPIVEFVAVGLGRVQIALLTERDG